MKKGGSSEGFTLIEVLIALTLLSIAVTFIVQLFSSNLRSLGSADSYVTAVKRAEFRMKELLDADVMEEGSWTETTDDGYRMDIAVSGTLTERTDYIYLKLMRIDLSIFWRNGPKEKKWTLRTLKALSKAIPGQVVAQK